MSQAHQAADPAALNMRRKREENAKKIAIGSTIARKNRRWTITEHKQASTGVWLTLKSGRREFRLFVFVSLAGPDLYWTGFKQVSPAPHQARLF